MANTYVLIASNTLSTTTSSVTFSSIPNTYTDLALRISGRTNQTGTANSSIRLFINGNTSAVYAFMRILGDGSSVTQYTSPTDVELYFNNALTATNATANAFGNAEIYIPNYLSTTDKPMGSFVVAENNSSNAAMGTAAGVAQITSAITSIEIQTNPSWSYVSGSSFYLYGIKNS